MRVRVRSAALLVIFAALPGYAGDSPVRAGIALVDITPAPGVNLPAYGTSRRAASVHDPLFARVLLLRTKETSLALITSDLYRFYVPALAVRIPRELQIDHIIFSASHSFSAPSLDEANSDWARATEDKIFQAVHKASQRLFSAEISWGRGALIGGHNIRIVGSDGTVRERWSDSEEEGTAPIDPSVTVIRIDGETGVPRAILVHYSCEPAVLGPDPPEISADYPGAAARYVERELGGNIVCLFALGAAANIYPFRSRLSGALAFSEIERMGQRVGREAVRVARTLKAPQGENNLQVRDAEIQFDRRWGDGKPFHVGVQTTLINRAVAFMAVPAQMFVEFQLGLSARSPAANTLLLSNSYSSGNSWAGYVPTITAAAEGGFGASYGTDIEVGAGEAMVNHGLIEFYRFLGQLDDLPRGRLVTEIPDLPSP